MTLFKTVSKVSPESETRGRDKMSHSISAVFLFACTLSESLVIFFFNFVCVPYLKVSPKLSLPFLFLPSSLPFCTCIALLPLGAAIISYLILHACVLTHLHVFWEVRWGGGVRLNEIELRGEIELRNACAHVVVLYLPNMNVNCLCICSSQSILCKCQCEEFRAHLEITPSSYL